MSKSSRERAMASQTDADFPREFSSADASERTSAVRLLGGSETREHRLQVEVPVGYMEREHAVFGEHAAYTESASRVSRCSRDRVRAERIENQHVIRAAGAFFNASRASPRTMCAGTAALDKYVKYCGS